MAVISTEVISVSTLLKNINLSIPHYQRPYKWSVKNVVQLIEDADRFKNQGSYRIGTVIVNKENELYHIVDGQQRTLTLSLIVKAIHAERTDLSSDLQQQVADIIAELFNPHFKSDISKQHIRENYFEILRRVRSMDESLIKFLLHGCKVTYLVIDDISEAFQFFDSQNSRGKELDPHDLLKAYHLREIARSEDHRIDINKLVQTWERMETRQLADLFSNFLYRVRGWSKGDSSRHFTKSDIGLFKGINLDAPQKYPYTRIYNVAKEYVESAEPSTEAATFPFQLDQTIINGQYFFQMISFYKEVFDTIEKHAKTLTGDAKEILNTINTYAGKDRTGDKYVRMLFDCALLYYVDKFGSDDLSRAICRIFIWAYSLRLNYRSLQMASVDNYVTGEINLFRKIRDSIFQEEIMQIELPVITEAIKSDKTKAIKELFIKMNYHYAR